jgi:hypothetical protein
MTGPVLPAPVTWPGKNSGAHWDVRLEETTRPVDRVLLQFLRLPPWVYRDLGIVR